MSGKIILLDGESSSGKSTLARGLQARLVLPFWHFSIDHLVAAEVLPKARIQSGEFRMHDLRQPFFDGFHRCVPALAEAGNNLLVEHIVETEEWLLRLLRLIGHLDVFTVRVRCPLPELERRERARGDRRIGEAREDYESAREFGIHDIDVDSTCALDRNVDTVIKAWTNRQPPCAFAKRAQSVVSI